MVLFKKRKIKKLVKKIRVFKQSRLSGQSDRETIAKEINLYFQLANLFESLLTNKKTPFARIQMLEAYRGAATLEDAEGNYLLGSELLEEAKCRQEMQSQQALDSPLNEQHQTQIFEEAHAYLKAADQLKHVQAKRLRGLCAINGWGVPANKEQGLDLIVASIDLEGSWDRVTEIFQSIGLNKSEYLSEIMRRQGSNQT